MQVRKSLLPFAVPSRNGMKAFVKEVEMGAIFCLAELERRKGRGIILKKLVEELLFIAEVCYPIWLIPWEGKALLFDGLDIIAHKLSFDTLPDVKTFLNEVEVSAGTREVYSASLSDNVNYFQRFIGRKERKIDGLIASLDFIQDFISYLPEAQAVKKPILDKVLLTPTIDEPSILNSTKELSNLKVTLREELNDLHRSMKLLSTTTQRHIKDIKDEIKQIHWEYREKIVRVKASIMEKLRGIKQKYNEEIVMISKRFDEKLQNLHQERVKLDKTMQSMTVKMERCEAEIKSCKLQRDEAGEFRWREELEKCKKELSNLQKSVKDVDEKIRDVDASKKLEISKLRSEYDQQAEAAKRELGVLEASRDAKIQMRQREMGSLEDITATIIDQISKLAEIKERALDELDKLGVKRVQRKHAIVYLPSYLVCYQTESKRRYVMYPPSIVTRMRIPTKIKGFFGSSMIKSLLYHRSKPITNFFNQFMSVVGRNPVFEKDLSDAAMGASILRTKESKEKIRMGIEELKNDKWISESEFRVFTDALMKA